MEVKKGTIIELTGDNLSIEKVIHIAQGRAKVQLNSQAFDRVVEERESLNKLARREEPIYGVNTGCGANRDVRIPDDRIDEFQRSVLLSHCVGTEEIHDDEVVRAILVCRANTLLKGGTGVQAGILKRHEDFINLGIHPLTPKKGSVGTGDLGQMAEQGLAFIGEGEVRYQGEQMPALQALGEEGLSPLTLGPKDGMILCCTNAATVGHMCAVLYRAEKTLWHLDLAGALSLEAFRGNLSPFQDKVVQSRAFAGQQKTSNRVNTFLQGSFLTEPQNQRSVQDPLSFRCMAQVHGECHDAYTFVKHALEIEMNSICDNPMFDAESEAFIHHGNFHSQPFVTRLEYLGLQLSSVTSMIQNRLQRLMNPEFSGLTKFLTNDPGVSSGFSTLQKTYSQLAAEIRHLANPGSLDSYNVANSVEDHGNMAPFIVQKTEDILEHLETIIGIELMVSSQGIDLLDKPTLGEATKIGYHSIRQFVPPLEEDRVISKDIKEVKTLVKRNEIIQGMKFGNETFSHSS
ncbi:histidine ammonia-lyase [Thalassobacillus sp. CUG 92003]|uniref:HAL/PAL/TAL family ammonia-lyase n=1 Tax=Thalassobacillus sp. CUG 92003 TaxID=2736641 RepID=UPI0015E6E180|nr:histidine ammonia-lyase [Thalassobacillus sp. CUG 92003]